MHSNAERYTLQAALTLDGLPSDAVWHIGLSAVIEETSGSYNVETLIEEVGACEKRLGLPSSGLKLDPN